MKSQIEVEAATPVFKLLCKLMKVLPAGKIYVEKLFACHMQVDISGNSLKKSHERREMQEGSGSPQMQINMSLSAIPHPDLNPGQPVSEMG